MEALQTLIEGTMTPLAWLCDFFPRGSQLGLSEHNLLFYLNGILRSL